MAALGDKILDKRIIERNIEKGLVTQDEYQQHLSTLPDRDGSFERVEVAPESSQEDTTLE